MSECGTGVYRWGHTLTACSSHCMIHHHFFLSTCRNLEKWKVSGGKEDGGLRRRGRNIPPSREKTTVMSFKVVPRGEHFGTVLATGRVSGGE